MYKPNSKYSKKQNSEFEFGVLDALMKYPGEYLTIEGIKGANGYILGNLPSQKVSRVLNTLVDMGLVKKQKNKNRMTYCSLATKEGDNVHTPFESEEGIYGNYFKVEESNSPIEINWALDEERKYL